LFGFATKVRCLPTILCLLHLAAHNADGGRGAQQQQQPHKKLSKVEELMQKDLQAKQRQQAAAGGSAAGSSKAVNGSKARLDHWLHEGIVVKVLSKALQQQGYYKQKV
jgi:hypothetical protein